MAHPLCVFQCHVVQKDWWVVNINNWATKPPQHEIKLLYWKMLCNCLRRKSEGVVKPLPWQPCFNSLEYCRFATAFEKKLNDSVKSVILYLIQIVLYHLLHWAFMSPKYVVIVDAMKFRMLHNADFPKGLHKYFIFTIIRHFSNNALLSTFICIKSYNLQFTYCKWRKRKIVWYQQMSICLPNKWINFCNLKMSATG